MRRFSAEYLSTTRSGMWDDREALAALDLSTRQHVLDVGAGTGALTQVLREETSGRVVALDADADLLGRIDPPRVVGDATRLPFADGCFDLVVCQALLINLGDLTAAIREFVRVSSDRVAAVEPDNSGVTVSSTVESEQDLAARARSWYLSGTTANPGLGEVREQFERAGLADVTVTRYDHVRTVEPPYSEQALESARRKATGEGIERNRDTLRGAGLTADEMDTLRTSWREMGRAVVDQMQTGAYRRRETVPFYVTAGRV